MNTIKHKVRRFYADGHGVLGNPQINITLPAVPNVIITSARPETAPTAPTIRVSHRRKPQGASKAMQQERKIDEVVSAIVAARAAALAPVTVAMEGME